MIDLHTHILPGLDDGARTLEESVAMARSAIADGIRVMAATPRVREDYPTRAAEMERGVGDLRQALAKEGLTLDVRTGGEIALDRLGTLEADELARSPGSPGRTGRARPGYRRLARRPPRPRRSRGRVPSSAWRISRWE